jgi:hypothetical protein
VPDVLSEKQSSVADDLSAEIERFAEQKRGKHVAQKIDDIFSDVLGTRIQKS